VGTNSANATSEFSGNYWDRYSGYDLDHDGVGDVPFAPVRLFALIVQQNQPTLILLRSFFVSLLDAAERVAPILTPPTMIDRAPLMRAPEGAGA
jgi:nitrous oxidase accessory protein